MIDQLPVLGASGDLVGRHLLPALAHLQEAGRLPQPLGIVGVAREDWDTAAFRRHLAAQLERHAATVDPGAREALAVWPATSGPRPATRPPWPARSTRPRAPSSPTWRCPRRPSPPRSRRWPRSDSRTEVGWWSISRSGAAWPRRVPSTSSWAAASGRRRPSAPTTSWARRRSRTCSGCGVPFRLRTGKALARRRAGILIHFRPTCQPTFAEAAGAPANLLRLGLDPDRLTLRVNLNGAGDPLRLEHATLDGGLAPQDVPAYGRLRRTPDPPRPRW